MSFLKQYLKGWGFRTNQPTFDPGEEIPVFVTGFEDGTAVARVGDSHLTLLDTPEDLVGSQVTVRVETFDTSTFVGEATLIEPAQEKPEAEPQDELTESVE